MSQTSASILLIYTGGTIGMVNDAETDRLIPFDFDNIFHHVPVLKKFGYTIHTFSLTPVIDSSDANPEFWIKLCRIIIENYQEYDGFVILHGTDTMAYTASALSYLLINTCKPIILTGSQLPIGTIRTDGRENLITAIEIAAAKHDNKPVVPEVCVYFENKLLRGNRTTKQNSEYFNAYKSNNYPPLAEAGISIKYNYAAIRNCFSYWEEYGLRTKTKLKFNSSVIILKIFPGISDKTIALLVQLSGLKGIVLETYGAGNAPTNPKFIASITDAVKRDIYVLNVTQCAAGRVEMTKYETSRQLLEAGVIGGEDITTEAAVTKLMFLLGQDLTKDEMCTNLSTPIAGEMTK